MSNIASITPATRSGTSTGAPRRPGLVAGRYRHGRVQVGHPLDDLRHESLERLLHIVLVAPAVGVEPLLVVVRSEVDEELVEV